MPVVHESFLVSNQLKCPKTYIETGLYLGDGIAHVLQNGKFAQLHGIELQADFASDCKKRFVNDKNISIYEGASEDVLKTLLPKIKESVVIFLDAHWSGGNTAKQQEICPILEELKSLQQHNYDDIIIIDDMRLVGKQSVSGNGRDYPFTEFDWRHVTLEKIHELLRPGFKCMMNDNRSITDGAVDQLVIWWPPKPETKEEVIVHLPPNLQKNPVVHVYAFCWNDETLVPAFLKHYKWASKITVYDCMSTDNSVNLVKAAGHTVVSYDSDNKLDDLLQVKLRNTMWEVSKNEADWIVVCDLDEFIHFPKYPNDSKTAITTLCDGFDVVQFACYTVVFEDEEWKTVSLCESPVTQITRGARHDIVWRDFIFDKPLMFNSRTIATTNFQHGGHGIVPTMKQQVPVKTYFNAGNAVMLHMKHLGINYEYARRIASRERLKHQFHLQLGVHYDMTDEKTLEKVQGWHKDVRVRDIHGLLFQNPSGELLPRVPSYVESWIYVHPYNNGSDFISGQVYAGNVWEPVLHAFIGRNCLRKKTVFVDCGANIGLHTLNAVACGAIRAYAFECNIGTMQKLKEAIATNGFQDVITPCQYAVSNTCNQAVVMHEMACNIGAAYITSVNARDLPGITSIRNDDVRTVTLDAYPFNFDCEQIILKLDVEGFEPEVIEGASNFLKNDLLTSVIVELNPDRLEIPRLKLLLETLIASGLNQLFIAFANDKDSWAGNAIPTTVRIHTLLHPTTLESVLSLLQKSVLVEVICTKTTIDY